MNSEINYSKFYNCCLIIQFCRYLSISTYSQKHAFKRWKLTLLKKKSKIKFFEIFLKNVFKKLLVLWGAYKWIQKVFISKIDNWRLVIHIYRCIFIYFCSQEYALNIWMHNWHFSKRKLKINIFQIFLLSLESKLSKDENWHYSKRKLKIKFF